MLLSLVVNSSVCFVVFSVIFFLCFIELAIVMNLKVLCMVPGPANTYTHTHSGTGPAPPIAAYTMVAPLLARQFCQIQRLGGEHQGAPPTVSPVVLAAPITTPLVADAWAAALQLHPARDWVEHLVTGMKEGFRIGLVREPCCQSSSGNTPSAMERAEVISDFLSSQCRAGYMLGPLPPKDCAGVFTSRMAVIPKKTPGTWRVIVDLSSPQDHNINDNLHRRLSHVSYASTDDAAMLMHYLGPGALLAKIDIQNAYRLVPIHPADRRFLGVSWQGSVYVDCQLPFGLATAPAIFNAIAEALEWILRSRGVRHVIHYLDDFLLLGHPNSDECAIALHTTLATCHELGVPLAADKVEGPAPLLTFLGIQLNTMTMSLGLPADKLASLRDLLLRIQGMKCIRNAHQLQSLIGHLNHMCQVMPLGRAFLNSLFPLANNMRQGQIRRLNAAARTDLAWWQIMLDNWSGTSIHQFLLLQEPSHHLFSDASGSWGCGAFSLPVWLQFAWPRENPLHSIALKELFPIVLACLVWGHQWTGTYVLCHSDNVAAVCQVNRLFARDPIAAHLLHCLALSMALFDFRIRAVHIAGSMNIGADQLSRDRAAAFLDRHPTAMSLPTQITQELTDLLLSPPHSWTSPLWRQLCGNFWKRV